jgi:hypothetical protein
VRGSRATCPACGKPGALSFRERNGQVSVHCFRCNGSRADLLAALDMAPSLKAHDERRRHAEADLREREAYARDPAAYLRGAVRCAYVRERERSEAEAGRPVPPTSHVVDRARRAVLRRLRGLGRDLELRDIPPAVGWPLWPRAASGGPWCAPDAAATMPAVWEWWPFCDDIAWPGIYIAALALELAPLRAADPAFAFEAVDNPWATLPHALYRAALRARAMMRGEVAP